MMAASQLNCIVTSCLIIVCRCGEEEEEEGRRGGEGWVKLYSHTHFNCTHTLSYSTKFLWASCKKFFSWSPLLYCIRFYFAKKFCGWIKIMKLVKFITLEILHCMVHSLILIFFLSLSLSLLSSPFLPLQWYIWYRWLSFDRSSRSPTFTFSSYNSKDGVIIFISSCLSHQRTCQ